MEGVALRAAVPAAGIQGASGAADCGESHEVVAAGALDRAARTLLLRVHLAPGKGHADVPSVSVAHALSLCANALVDCIGTPSCSAPPHPRHADAPTVSWTVSKPPPLPPRLILVTPTYTRAFQAAYITELTHTLRLVPPPHTWIVVESGNKTDETAMLLERTAGYCAAAEAGGCRKLEYVHIATGDDEDQRWFRGVGQRNQALEYIERENLEGIVYFMDDDNSYALQLFQELRKIHRIGLLPVGFLFGKDSPMRSYVGRPIVRVPLEGVERESERESDSSVEGSSGSTGGSSSTGGSGSGSGGGSGSSSGNGATPGAATVSKASSAGARGAGGGGGSGYAGEEMEQVAQARVVGWEAYGRRVPLQRDPEARRYIMDMAGFAFSTEALRNGTVQGKKQSIRFRPSKRGFLETDFLEQLVTHEDEFEVLADGCRAVWVWHKHMEDLSWATYPTDWQPEQSNHRIPTYDWVKNDTSHEARAGLIGRIARMANVTLPPSFEEMKREDAVREKGVRVANGQKADLGRNVGVASRGDTGGRSKLRGKREDGTISVQQARRGMQPPRK
ncbi:unnamed protein product [Closterium sp. Naga37s-1]|nr:unnamed protein product [Closterium sp. Naga37s-1]